MVEIASRIQLPNWAPGFVHAWNRLTLTTQFVIAGSIFLIIGMIVVGLWVTGKIEEVVTKNTAAATALYMESVVSPLVQELANSKQVSAKTHKKLDEILTNSEIGRKIISFKIWKEGGLIAYSSRGEITGKVFPTTPALRAAWKGEVTADFDALGDEEDALERNANMPLLEMYSPIREEHTGRIIAVAEFYEEAADLKRSLLRSQLQSAAIVASLTLALLAALSGVVIRGSRTIERQRLMLERRVEELSTLLDQNVELRTRLQRASYRTAEANEHYLRRISADLHDGPAQSMALALLRLDSLEPLISTQDAQEAGSDNFNVIREALRDAIAEIREVCIGLTLPKLEELSTAQILEQVVNAHERRTGTEVNLSIESRGERLHQPLKICIFRFLQEALNNAFRHADGADQSVSYRSDGVDLTIEVSDQGCGFVPTEVSASETGLGLIGLRERIESLGGTLEISSAPGKGTRLVMHCSVAPEC